MTCVHDWVKWRSRSRCAFSSVIMSSQIKWPGLVWSSHVCYWWLGVMCKLCGQFASTVIVCTVLFILMFLTVHRRLLYVHLVHGIVRDNVLLVTLLVDRWMFTCIPGIH